MSFYYNMAGQRFILPERALEPEDCRRKQNDEPEEKEDQYDEE